MQSDKDAKSAAQASADPAAATVNGTPISQRTVDMMVKQGADSGHPDTPETRKAIIDQLTLQMVIAQEAVKKGLDKTPEVAEQIDAVKQSVLANAYVQDYIKNNPVTDDMLKAEYERIKATVTGTEYKARHILVEKEAEAKDIIAKLKKDPGAFEKLAMEKSKDQGSKAKGGDLGWFDFADGARIRRSREQARKGQVHGGAGQDPVRLSRHPARGLQADRGAAAGRGQAAAHPAASAAERDEAGGCAQGQGQDRSCRRLRFGTASTRFIAGQVSGSVATWE